MASDYSDIPEFLATREGEAYGSQFAPNDYGRVGDQRPYQVVFPSYPAPKFLQRFMRLEEALRECGTLCKLTGKPFRLVKWGARLPCYPHCQPRKTASRLPSLRITSPGAIEGYPDAQPIAEFNPHTGTIVYDSKGRPKMVGVPNFHVTRKPCPTGPNGAKSYKGAVDFDTPVPVRYEQAVKTAQRIAGGTGRPAYICSSMGAHCKGKPDKWIPVVYVQPGGLVRRYPGAMPLGKSKSQVGSTNVVSPVTEDAFREMLRESAGRSRLAQGH